MADISPERKMIQQEETRPQAAVTESVMSRVGAGINFINQKHFYIKEYCVNGKYNIILPNLEIDGFFTYPWDFEIVDMIIKMGPSNGTSGLSEVDLKWKPENSGVWQSIFSTTPKWTPAAAVDSSVRLGQSTPGWTTPVLSKTIFNPYDQIRLDILQGQGGPVNSFFITIFTRPKNP